MAGGKIDILVSPDVSKFPNELEGGLKGALGTAGKLGAAIGAALGGAATVKGIASLGLEFDKQMNTMAAVSQATAPQLAAVEAKARELGKAADLTATSASDAGAAMTELVKGGFSVAQSMDAAKGTLQLASAAQIDAASAATIQSQALQAFGLDASYAAKASDVLAGAANASSAEIEGIAQGLSQSGAVANQFKLTIEDNATALAMFANAGIQGSDAGTLLKSALLKLAAPSEPAQGAIEELGLTVHNAAGEFVGMESLMGQLQEASKGMTDEQYNAATATLFGSDAMRLAGVAAREGADGWRETYSAVTRAGQASEVAAAQAQGLPGILEAVQNQAEDTGLAIYDAFSGIALDGGGKLIEMMQQAGPMIEGAAQGIASGLNSALPAVERVVGVLGDGLGQVADSVGVLGGAGVDAIQGIAGALAPAASGALNLSEGLGSMTGPLMAAGAALAVGKWQDWGGALESGTGKLSDMAARVREQAQVQKALAASQGVTLSSTKALGASMQAQIPWVGRAAQAYRDNGAELRTLAVNQKRWAAETVSVTGEFHTFAANADRSRAALNSFRGVLGGSFAAAGSAAKSAIGGITDALGGPWNLAIAGATIAVTGITGAIDETRKSKELLSDLAGQADKTGDALFEAMSKGDLTAEIDALNDSLSNLLETNKQLADTGPGFWGGVKDALAGWGADLNPFDGGKTNNDVFAAHKAQEEAAKQAQAFSEAIEQAGVSAEQAAAAIGGTDAQYDALIGRLDLTTEGGRAAAESFQKQRDEYQRMQQIMAELAPGSVELSEALAKIGDESASSEDKVSALKAALDNIMGIKPDSFEAVSKLQEGIDDVTESAQKAVDESKGFGDTLFGEDGALNPKQDNAVALHDAIMDMRDSLAQVAIAGEDVQGNYEDQMAALELLGASYGLSAEQVHQLADDMGLVPSVVESLVSVSTSEALAGLGEVYGAIEKNELKVGEPLKIKVENIDESTKKLEEFGFKVEELQRNEDGSGAIKITADTQEAIDNVDLLVQAVNAVQSEKGLTFTSNSLDEVDNIRRLGFEVEDLGDGEYKINSNTPEQIQLMIDLGILVADPKTGELSINSNIDDILDKASKLDARQGNVTKETHQVDEVTNRIEYFQSINKGMSASDASKIQGPTPYTPKRASGGRHGGYRLPTDGPGTGVVDGFAAFDSDGAPSAMLDAGEWVINGASSEEYNRELAEINAGIFPKLPGYAEGARHAKKSDVATATAGAASAAATGIQATVTLDAEGVADEITKIDDSLAPLEEEKVIPVTADTAVATSNLEGVSKVASALPESEAVKVAADTGAAVTSLQETTDTATALGEMEVSPTIAVDSDELSGEIEGAEESLTSLNDVTVEPVAGLIADDLYSEAASAEGELDALDSQTPTPEADVETSSLSAGVEQATGELQQLGSSKATSVADVNNASALTNIDSVIQELNKMPVERVIKVVAQGSLGGLASGGKVDGLAAGGQIAGGYKLPTTGPGTGIVDGFMGVDDQGMPLVRVNAGEWVINDAASRVYDKELAMINAGIFPKLDNLDMIPGADKMPGLFKGGVVSPDQLLSFARGNAVRGFTPPGSLEGSPYIWGGGLLGNWGDCSGAMSGLAALASGGDPNGRKFATGSEGAVLQSMGFMPGIGPKETSFNIGWFNGGPWGGHTAGDINGIAVEMGGGRGNGQIGGAAASASSPQFTDHAHIPLGILVAFDYFRDIARVARSYQQPPAPEFSGLGGLGVGPGGEGIGLYDQGGLWPSGTLGMNLSGRNERVLTGAENDLYEGAMKGFPGLVTAVNKAADKLGGAASELERAAMGLETTGDNLSYFVGKGGASQIIGGVDLSNFGGDWVRQAKAVKEAEADLVEVRKKIADEDSTISERSQELAEARQALSEAEQESIDVSTSNARKLEDKQRALDEARGEGKADKIADAERDLARAREDAATDSAKAESKRAESIQKATENVEKKEEALTEARADSATQAARLEEAERKIVAARFQAIADLADKVGTSLNSVFTGMSDLFGVLAKHAGVMEQTRQQLAKERIERQAADLAEQRSRLDAVIAEQDMAKARANGAIAIADAEAALEAARAAAALKGATSIDAMSEALDRARKTGKFTLEDIAQSVIDNASEVRAAEAAVEQAKAQAALDELNAVHAHKQALLDLAQATLTQQKAVALVDISTRQLALQAAQLGGLTAEGAQRASSGWGGLATAGGGLGKLIAGIAGGVAGFATGGPLGALIGGGAGVISGLFDLLKGGREAWNNRDEIKDSWEGMSTIDKIITGGGILAGGGVAAAGAAASNQYGGPEMAAAAAELAAQIAQQSAGYAQSAIDSDLNRVNSLAEEERKRLELETQLAQAKIDAERAKQEMEYLKQSTALQADVDIAELLGKLAQADTTKQADALANAAIVAAERRDQMLDLLAKQVEIAENAQANTPRPVIQVNIPESDYSRMEHQYDSLIDSLNKVQMQLEFRKGEITGSQYLAAQTS